MPDRPVCMIFGRATDPMLARLGDVFEVLSPDADTREEVLQARGADIGYAMLIGHTRIDAPVMDRMPNLRILSNFGVGYDAIDTDAALARDIVVTHTPDVLNDEVANTAILLMLGVARNMVQDDAYVRAGRWASGGNAPLSRSVRGLRAGIVGFGRIGQAIAQKLTVFGTEIVYHARSDKGVDYRYYGDLVEMAADCDILIVITPGGPETQHLINARVMDALGPDGILINVARGSVVDEAALIDALRAGRLGAAGLDVFENEPHVPEALFGMDNVTLLPHVGSATVETRAAMGNLAVENLLTFHRDGTTVTPVPECQS